MVARATTQTPPPDAPHGHFTYLDDWSEPDVESPVVIARSGRRRPDHARSQAHYQCLQTEPGRLRWRLLVGNGRCLGRSVATFRNVKDVLDGIAHLQRVGSQVRVVATFDRTGSGWRLLVGDDALAESTHLYDRQVESMRAADRFLQYAPHALLDPVIAVSRTRATQSLRHP